MTPEPLSPDEIEQRQRPDGTVEQETPRRPTADDAPRSADEIEQQQPATPDEAGDDLDDAEEPLSPDQIEQRMAAGVEDEPAVAPEDEA